MDLINNRAIDSTYNKLVEAGIKLFGEFGFDGVSIREIVRESGANLSAVSYHFGGKLELYQAVVEYLVTEVSLQLDKLQVDQFIQMELAEMEVRLPHIIEDFKQLFISAHGASRLNIFNRESASSDTNRTHHSCKSLLEMVSTVFARILSAYYTRRNEPLDKIEFVINLLIAVLKSIYDRQRMYGLTNHELEDTSQRLIKLVLYGTV